MNLRGNSAWRCWLLLSFIFGLAHNALGQEGTAGHFFDRGSIVLSNLGMALPPPTPEHFGAYTSQETNGSPAGEFRISHGWDATRTVESSPRLPPVEKAEPSTSVDYSQRAAEQYERAATAKPNDYGAQLMWANCLSKLSQTATNTIGRQSFARSARERFAIAARCAGADWRVYYNWATLLTVCADGLARSPAESMAMLTEARALFEKAMALAPFSGDKAGVEHDSGMCLVMLAERTSNARDRRSLYEQAITQIGAAADRSPKLMTSRSFGLWGVALLQVAKLDNNRMLIRQAVERLLSSLEIDPNHTVARYNLVCAYALLDQPDNALRHLRVCLDNDPNRTYYNTASADPDLWSLRRTAEYNAIFNSSPATNAFPQPLLSE